jgi:hypothetical protein
MTKNYMLFGGQRYYPTGGASDLLGIFDTADEAVKFTDLEPKDQLNSLEWWHIYSIKGGEVVCKSKENPYGGV